MGQREVLKVLEDKRIFSDSFLTVKEIQKTLKEQKFGNGVIKGVSNDLFKLALFGQVEWRGRGIWHHQKLFRGKKKL